MTGMWWIDLVEIHSVNVVQNDKNTTLDECEFVADQHNHGTAEHEQ